MWSLGNSIMAPALTAYTADISGTENRGQAMALARQASDVAFLVAPVGLGALAELTSCNTALQITALAIVGAGGFFRSRARESAFYKAGRK